ncbi:minichromosome maintenance domain-containing protein 2 isoform X2 [Synchiropus splendidus]|uniref:minichromosome maintenance domain-containing protein 2 isoform X2 n=1 Tax=Synchiropus splendidus TaxID=270530 RepID=UPI00237EC509|nr:minichromosome maintenance domain-containing protein 2 isoform X2 [Synchiropus splendidus]
MCEILALKESVLIYLDRSGALEKLIEDCKSFDGPQQNDAVYRFYVRVSPTDLTEVDSVLGDFVLHNPRKATALFQSVCFLAIKTLSLVRKIHTENQVNVILKWTHLPPFPEYCLHLDTFPRGHVTMRPVLIEGLVVAMTRVTKYTGAARFLCTDDDCPAFTGFHHIRVHAPGATESATMRNDFICSMCSSPLKEDVKFRVLGDKQLVELIHTKAIDALSAKQSSVRFQSVTFFLRDELCNSMRLGHLYSVVGIPAHVHQWPNITWSIEANGVRKLEREGPQNISNTLQELLQTTSSSPWRFSAILAHCFGLDVTPPGLYNTLKLVLLLSLVQTRAAAEETFHCLDLLIVTCDSLIVDRLMMYSLGFAPRGVRHRATGEMFASLCRDEHGTGNANIHAGSAFLASGGICMLGDLCFYQKDKLDTLESALESRHVSVFIPGRKYGEDSNDQLSFPVPCSFWALSDSTPSFHRPGRSVQAAVGAGDIGSVSMHLADAFGLVVQCQDEAGKDALATLTAHVLQQAVWPGEDLYPASIKLSCQDYKELIAHAQSLQVALSDGALKVIRGYYMASRRVRTLSQISMPSVKLLISLAEAHCRLSLRTLALEEDAIVAVLLCETSVTFRHGASALTVPAHALFPCSLADGGLRRDAILDEFHQAVLRFIFSYVPGAEAYIREE